MSENYGARQYCAKCGGQTYPLTGFRCRCGLPQPYEREKIEPLICPPGFTMRTHPPVLPVGDMFQQDNGGFWHCFFFNSVLVPLENPSKEGRLIIAALQRCKWLDARSLEKDESEKLLEKAFPNEKFENYHAMRERSLRVAGAWNTWEKGAGE